MTSVLVENQLTEVDGGLGSFDLPAGYFDGEVLHRAVVLRSLRGTEEKILASKAVKNADKMDMILSNCIVRLGDITNPDLIRFATPKLPLADRTLLLLNVRVVSHGPLLPFKKQCPNTECKQSHIYEIDLREAEVFPMENPSRRVFEDKLPSGPTVVWKVLTGEGESKRDALRNKVDPLTLSLLLRVESIDGTPVTTKMLEDLSVRDRDFLRGVFEDREGGVDTSIQLACPFCGEAFEAEIDPGDGAFFFPSVTQSRWKRKSSH